MRNIIDILKPIVEDIQPEVTVKSVTDNLDGSYTIETCGIYYLQTGFTIIINSVDYTVSNITGNTILVIGSVLPPVQNFTLYAPYFFHGTVTQTNVELTSVEDAALKTPMVYLYETLKEKVLDPMESPVEFEAEVRLFFLTQANFADWKTADYYGEAIKPMSILADLFKKALDTAIGIGLLGDADRVSHTKFGVHINDKGYEKFLFNDHLSGVEVRMNIPILNKFSCEIC